MNRLIDTLEPRAQIPEVVDEVLDCMDWAREGDFIHTPSLRVGLQELFALVGANCPHQTGSRTVRRLDVPIAERAALGSVPV